MAIDNAPLVVDTDDIYRTLLESTKAIPWKVDWDSQRYAYVGPQIEALLGWKTTDWATVNDWAQRIHPQEREQVVNRCVQLSLQGVDHEADYRALTADGRYVWVRETVHVLRKPDGAPLALVGFLFDISERKAREEHILQLQRELEALSYKDSLTQIANRRCFDGALVQAWQQGLEAQVPLSLLLVDVDFFKPLNDHYGHIYGDQCLVQVAQSLSRACDKHDDLVARLGGEEFAVLLPGVDVAIACQVAERFQRLLQAQGIAHAHSPFAQCLTASVGVGSVVPQPGMQSIDFVQAVDTLLYQAKKAGRNHVACAVWDGQLRCHGAALAKA